MGNYFLNYFWYEQAIIKVLTEKQKNKQKIIGIEFFLTTFNDAWKIIELLIFKPNIW